MGGAGGRVIRWLQRFNGDGFADYEHVRVLKEVRGRNLGLFFEAQPGGAVFAEHELDGEGRFWSTGILKPTVAQRGRMVEAMERYGPHDGKPGVGYSWADYAALALRRLGFTAPLLRKFIETVKHMICSQAGARIWWDGGFPLFDRWTGYTTPGDIYQLLVARSRKLEHGNGPAPGVNRWGAVSCA